MISFLRYNSNNLPLFESEYGIDARKYNPMILGDMFTVFVENGAISVYKKYMSPTVKRAIKKYLADIFEQFNTPSKERVFVTHTAIESEVVDMVKEVLQEKGFDQILETVAGSTITSHCGPGTLGIIYHKK